MIIRETFVMNMLQKIIELKFFVRKMEELVLLEILD